MITGDKTGVVAKRLNIHPNTVRNYADKYSDLLSSDATGRKRTFNYDDLLILATVSEFRDRGMEWEQIRVALEAGQRVGFVPELETPEIASARKALDLVPKPHYERLQDEKRQVEQQLQEANSRLERVMLESQKELSQVRDTWQNEVTQLKNNIATLERDKGILEGQLEIIKAERKPAAYWLAVIAVITITVVIIAGVIVLYMARG